MSMPSLDRAPDGLFLSFEGIDGAGKSTHLGALEQRLRSLGWRVLRTREPGGTVLAERLRELLLTQAMDPLCEALLVFAARRDHLKQVIEPALREGAVVLCDRFTDATFAYQGHGRGFDLSVLGTLERWVQARGEGRSDLREPDLTLWFDVPPAVAAQRLVQARTPDRFEAESQAFFERVAQGYVARAALAPQRIVRLDAAQAPEDVWVSLWQAVQTRLPQPPQNRNGSLA